MDEREPVYEEIRIYKGWPVISTNDDKLLPKDMIARFSKEGLLIRTEAIDTLQEIKKQDSIPKHKYGEYLDTILEHILRGNIYYSDSLHGPRTEREKEVDEFFRNCGYFK